jgi:hypothetical protein
MKLTREHLVELLKELGVSPERVLKEYDAALDMYGSSRIAYRFALMMAADVIGQEESRFA